VPRQQLDIQTTPPHGSPALVSALEPILIVTMPCMPETFNTITDKMRHGTELEWVILLHSNNVNLIQGDLNNDMDRPENRCNPDFVSYDRLTLRTKPSCIGQLSYCASSFCIFDKLHLYKTRNSVAWHIAMNAKIRFKLQVTATVWFHSLYDWCYAAMWLCSAAADDAEDKTVKERHGADALNSLVNSWRHVIRTGDQEGQYDMPHHMINIAKT
jgi:hypothetical protein